MKQVFHLRSNTCVCIFIVSFEETCQNIGLHASSRVENRWKKRWKHSVYGLALSSVSRCLPPLNETLPLVLDILHKHSFFPVEKVKKKSRKLEWNNLVYYSFKIFPQFWLAKSTPIIHHNQLLMTKFERILWWTRKWRQKCSQLQVKAPLSRKSWNEV